MTGDFLAEREGLQLQVPHCEFGIGSMILSPTSDKLIDGVKVQPAGLWPDDRGAFMEILRVGNGLAAAFPPATTQVSTAMSYAGSIKAFHFHLHQTDCWTPAFGMFQFVLADFRPASPTFGVKNTLYVGTMRPWQVLIPPGVGHGYKVIGKEPATLIYVTDRFYNPADEGRVAYNDSRINYDWELQHK